MKYHITHRTIYQYTEPVSVCHNLVRLAPRQMPSQVPQDYQLQVVPEPITRSRRFDYFGNQVEYFTIQEAHRELAIATTSVVEVSPPPPATTSPAWEQVLEQLHTDRSAQGLEAYHLSLPTERTSNLEALRDYAADSFGKARPICDAVDELVARIHADFAFDPLATTVHSSAADLLSVRRGVCQDFTHFAIGCVRAMGLAARYVSGYVRNDPPAGSPRLVGGDASHAWLAVYAGATGWVDFDPTNNLRVGTDHITVAWGRDYADICPIQGVFVGGGQHSMQFGVDVVPSGQG
ncbi:MAG: transglutaminase family protein [Pirellulales bacterium]